ncbi:MAG TPA: hypothetical protein VEI97_08985 [bacterium]|nr:hypothetical protein [bacterium]
MTRPIAKLATLLPVLAVLLFLVAPRAQAQACPHYFCTSDAYCASRCPSAALAVCTSEFHCDYVYDNEPVDPTPPNCPTAFCEDAQDCLAACPAASNALCKSNNSCLYY